MQSMGMYGGICTLNVTKGKVKGTENKLMTDCHFSCALSMSAWGCIFPTFEALDKISDLCNIEKHTSFPLYGMKSWLCVYVWHVWMHACADVSIEILLHMTCRALLSLY